MIREKEIKVPAVKGKTLRITPSYLKSSERVTRFAPIGLCEENGKLVAAEGTEDVGTMSATALSLNAVRGELLWRTDETTFYRHSDGMILGIGFTADDVLSYSDPSGVLATLFVGAEKTMLIRGIAVKDLTPAVGTGSCAAIHHERIFVGKGNTLTYSAPLDPENGESSRAGSIDLPVTGGEIVALLSFGERLYVFRSRELLRLRADANDLNFSFERVHLSYGGLRKGTLRPCGREFVFAAARHLVVGDGSTFRYLPFSRFGITFPDDAQTGQSDGKYYALVTTEGGQRRIFIYDPAGDTYHFLDVDADLLSGAGEGIYFRHGTRLCRLTPKNLSEGKPCGSLEGELGMSDDGGKERRIDAVSVTGRGNFRLTLETDKGRSELSLAAGRRARLAHVLRGNFLQFTLQAEDPACEIAALELYFREETP